jgi:pimeloyl-ACP methyl ester carboxylesterase
MNVRLRNRVRISGRPGVPVVVLAHGFGWHQNRWRGRTAEQKVRDLAARLRQLTVPHPDEVDQGEE